MISLRKNPSIHRKTIVIKFTFLIDIYLTDCCSPMSKPTLWGRPRSKKLHR